MFRVFKKLLWHLNTCSWWNESSFFVSFLISFTQTWTHTILFFCLVSTQFGGLIIFCALKLPNICVNKIVQNADIGASQSCCGSFHSYDSTVTFPWFSPLFPKLQTPSAPPSSKAVSMSTWSTAHPLPPSPPPTLRSRSLRMSDRARCPTL